MSISHCVRKYSSIRKKESRDSTPVKLATYLFNRQASKGKQRTNLPSSRYDDEIQLKRSKIIDLIQRLIDQLVQNKISVYSLQIQQLTEMQKKIQSMLQSMVSRTRYSDKLSNNTKKQQFTKILRNNCITTIEKDLNKILDSDNFKLNILSPQKTIKSRLSDPFHNPDDTLDKTPILSLIKASSQTSQFKQFPTNSNFKTQQTLSNRSNRLNPSKKSIIIRQ